MNTFGKFSHNYTVIVVQNILLITVATLQTLRKCLKLHGTAKKSYI